MAPLAAAAASGPDSASGAVQLLLRNTDSRTTVIQAQRGDTLDSVLDGLGKGAARRGELRVVYAGRELPRGATIGEIGLPRDATIHVSSRLRSTPHVDAWNLASEIVTAARFAAARGQTTEVTPLVSSFLDLAHAALKIESPSSLGAVADHLEIFLRSGAAVVLVQQYLSGDEPRRIDAERAIRCFLSGSLPTALSMCGRCRCSWSSADTSPPPMSGLAEQVNRFAGETAKAVMEEISGAYCLPTTAATVATMKYTVEFKIFWSVLLKLVLELDADTPHLPWRTALSEALVSLLRSVDECMARFEKSLPRPPWGEHAVLSSAPPKWTASLRSVWAVLAELDAWSQQDAWWVVGRALRATLAEHSAAVTALVLSSGRDLRLNISWITRHRDLLPFEARRHLAMAMLPELVTGIHYFEFTGRMDDCISPDAQNTCINQIFIDYLFTPKLIPIKFGLSPHFLLLPSPNWPRNPMAHSAAAASGPDSSSGAVQLLLRNIDSRTTVIRAQRDDTLDSVLDRLGKGGVARRGGLRVVYAGRELRPEATIGELGLPWDATLHVFARLLSTPHVDAWSLASEITTAARIASAGQQAAADSLEKLVTRFLDFDRAAIAKVCSGSLWDVDEHLDVFLRSEAPALLVQLYLSKDEACHGGAERAIRCFLSDYNVWTVPVLLEFCGSFAAGAREGDRLYTAFRGLLATALTDSDPTPERWRGLPRQWVAEQLTQLAGEMANAVIEEIASSTAPTSNFLADFKIFWSVLREQVLELDADMPWRKALSRTLTSLLMSVKGCMARFEMSLPPRRKHASSPSSAPPKWTASLSLHIVWAVLAELDAWSDVHHAMRTTLAAHATAATALVLSAGREFNIRWITRYRDLLEFEARRHLAMAMLPELVTGSDAPPPHQMLIDRSRLLLDSFVYIAHATPQELGSALFVEFRHEQATGPGVLREWFSLVCQALFKPRVLFSACPHNRRRLFVNPTSVVDPLHLQYFKFSGRIIALALIHKIQVGVFFDRTLFLQLAGRPITLDDIADADPSFHASCNKILKMDPTLVDSDMLVLRFVREVEVLGSRTVTELFPGGEDTSVNSENRYKYIDLLIQDRFVNCTRRQLAHFAEGFSSMLGETISQTEFFESLDVEDFDEILGGSKDSIDVKEWRAYTHYRGYEDNDCEINWFWEAVESMTDEQQRRLLFFWTSVKYLPSDGFLGLSSRLFIFRASSSRDHLPTSQTCFYSLNLPAYTSLSMTQSRLHMIVQEHVSCGFGAS
ncbi:E3 ubiquitin-protein ligase UPL5 [Dichanthelium oligosanthes]|uniref:HECT-type E3 ubiquitin transferase n=1 Tax=Dichanthelium oligosanthes TaxID=888268 RepID=A0A1E5V605_9POAL|nr:E3 ubiquitin-protein ligase UPL5 [Dichanthelium oligosanthes]